VPQLCVLLLHSSDEPDRAAAALEAAHAATAVGRPAALYLASEGSRVAARGVAEALSGGGRPDLASLLSRFVARGGRVLVSGPCWRARGFAADALVPGGAVVEPEALSNLAAEGYVFASF
jgi:predicted peroxiredoxin